jgi:hypothetical protein
MIGEIPEARSHSPEGMTIGGTHEMDLPKRSVIE